MVRHSGPCNSKYQNLVQLRLSRSDSDACRDRRNSHPLDPTLLAFLSILAETRMNARSEPLLGCDPSKQIRELDPLRITESGTD
jgi:hypothetical protein